MRARRLRYILPALGGGILMETLPAQAADGASAPAIHPALILPFVLLLLMIAVMPLIHRQWWERYYAFLSLGLGGLTVLYYALVLRNPGRIVESASDYLSFIVFTGSVFTVAGGIHIRIRGESSPLSNMLMLAIGAAAANIFGTIGASMILIRPFLRANKHRLRGFHVVFFIFLVSNIGGALLPTAGPPLFLGYLRGVPFFWVLEHAWPIWIVAVAVLLLLFGGLDYVSYKDFRARSSGKEIREEAHLSGLHNLGFICLIILALFIEHPRFLREILMLVAAAASYATTRAEIRQKNGFNFVPVREVAVLFFGIFATMAPALDWLEANAGGTGIAGPAGFYWSTGLLSGALDNAPAYLSALSASFGAFVDQNMITQVQHLVSRHGADLTAVNGTHAEEIRRTFSALVQYHSELVAAGAVSPDQVRIAYMIANQGIYLKAISVAGVFFGAFTYIGNGPNFMVKSIADQLGASSPGFSSYILRYSVPILVPLFVLIWFLFFRT